MSRKRKVDADGRLFQQRWEGEYMFVLQGERPVCLLCCEAVSVIKEYNLRRHFDTKHGAKYGKASLQEKQQIAQELKDKLKSQQNLFTKATAKNSASVKASFIVAEEIARASKSFSEGAFLKQCMLKVCEQVCPDQIQTFKNVSLSRNTIVDRVKELAENLATQLAEETRSYTAFSLAVDESTDNTDTAQLAIFIRGVKSDLSVTEELLDVATVHRQCVEKKMAWVGLNEGENAKNELSHCPLITYHCIIHQEVYIGPRSLNGDFIGRVFLNHRQFQMFLQEIDSEHGECAVPKYRKVRWLSRHSGKTLLFSCRVKRTPMSELQIQSGLHLAQLNQKLQGRQTSHYADVRYDHAKQDNLADSPFVRACQPYFLGLFRVLSLTTKLSRLKTEFDRRFSDFRGQQSGFAIFANPFTTDVLHFPRSAIQGTFTGCCPPGLMPHAFRLHAARVLSMFGSTYLCEQMFSIMNLNKNKHRSRLTDDNLHAVLRMASAQDLKPDIDTLVMGKQCADHLKFSCRSAPMMIQ
uniref:SPIN-DOC-like zinc-finger domain-containing protein n=1 Tax=Astyanax mexicanus TaxID=7994 RepID=A0A3B1IVA2_ASTMX